MVDAVADDIDATDEVTGRPQGALLPWTRPCPQKGERVGLAAVNCRDGCGGCCYEQDCGGGG